MKQPKESRELRGEVEGYSTKITPFPSKRGSRGLKLENEWHNVVGSEDFLELLTKTFPVGSFVKFTEEKNNKGYWDVKEGSLKKLTKEQCYNQDLTEDIQEPVTEAEDIADTPENRRKLDLPPKEAKEKKSKRKWEIFCAGNGGVFSLIQDTAILEERVFEDFSKGCLWMIETDKKYQDASN